MEIPETVGKNNSVLLTYTIELELGESISNDFKYINAYVEITLDSKEIVTLDPIQLDL